MNANALTPTEVAGIRNARESVAKIANAVPDTMHGDQLVLSLILMLRTTQPHNLQFANHGHIGLAAAAIAALVEVKRGIEAGERSVVE